MKKNKELEKQKIRDSIINFKNLHGRFPTTEDFGVGDLTYRKKIERLFGGVVALKREIGAGNDSDARTGKTRSNKAMEINKRNNEIEGEYYLKFKERFGEVNVHRNWAIDLDGKTNIDFVIFFPEEKLAVGLELFFPSSRHSFNGCMNIKKKKRQLLNKLDDWNTSFWFVVTNKNIEQAEIDLWESKRKNVKNYNGVISINNIWEVLSKNRF
jgi:hypothetical protein